MTLQNCIAVTARELGISEAEAEEIADRINAYRKRVAAEGELSRVEEQVRRFAKSEAEKARIAGALKRKQAALTVLVRHSVNQWLDAQVARGVPIHEAVTSYLVGGIHARDSVSARRMALEGDWLRGMLAEAQARVPAALELVKRPKDVAAGFFHDVVREMYELREGGEPGRTGNRDARELAGIFARYAEASRLEANRAGANIGRLDGWAGPQAHDERLMLKAGQEPWVDAILPELDLERSFGPNTSPAEARDHLREVFLTIVTGRDRAISGAERGERLGPSNIANSLGEHRVLHFRDAEAWIRYSDQFARGNIMTAMLDHLGATARKVSLLQMLGPNPETLLRSVLDERARRERLNSAGREKEATEVMARLRLGTGYSGTQIGKAWAVVSGNSSIPSNVSRARFWANARSLIGMAKLGAALMSQFSDLATFGAAMHDQGRNVLVGQADALRGLVAGGGAEARHRAMLLGVAGESILADIHTRFSGDEGPMGKMATATAAFYRVSGLRWWSDRLETAFANMTSAWMATKAEHAFDQLDPAYRHILGLHGISAERWELVRQAVEEANGNRHVMPDKIADMPEEMFDGLVRDRLDAVEKAAQDRLGKLKGMDDREAEWAQKRADRLAQKVADAGDRLQAFRNSLQGRRSAALEEVEAKMEVVRARAEQANALAEIVAGERGMGVRDLVKDLVDGFERGGSARAGKVASYGQTAAFRSGEAIGARLAKAEAKVRDLAQRGAGLVAETDKRIAAESERTRAMLERRSDEAQAFIDRMQERRQARAVEAGKVPQQAAERISRLRQDARRALELDVRGFFADEAAYGVLKADDRTRMVMTQGVPPGSALGEVIRFVGQFQAFTVSYGQRRLGRSFRGYAGADPSAGFWRGVGTGAVKNLPAIATLIAFSTVYGYLSSAAKDIVKNRTPKDPHKIPTWLAAMAQGGGAGLFGDYLFGAVDRFGGGLPSRLIGPGIGEAVNLIELLQELRQRAVHGITGEGDKGAKLADFINFGLNNTPYLNLYFLRPVLDLAILNQWQEWASPGTFQRRQRNVLDQFGQRYLLNPTPLAGRRPAGVSP